MRNVATKATEGKTVFCGIDLHSAEMVAAIAVDRGPIIYRSYGVLEEGVWRLITALRKRGETVYAVYEASGQGFGLADALVAAGIKAAVVAPTEIEKSARGRVRKTDREDARRLLKLVRSHVLADGDLPAVWIPDKGLRDDREIVRCRLKLGDDLARVKNRIHGLLKRHGARQSADRGAGRGRPERDGLPDRDGRSDAIHQPKEGGQLAGADPAHA